jgi:hypothetical protein
MKSQSLVENLLLTKGIVFSHEFVHMRISDHRKIICRLIEKGLPIQRKWVENNGNKVRAYIYRPEQLKLI